MKSVSKIPFDFDRKEMTALHKSDDASPFAKGFKFISLTKGAPEAVVAQLKAVLIEGSIREPSDAARGELLSVGQSLAVQGYRVMAVGFKGLGSEDEGDLKRDLVFLGLLDPPRKEIYAAIDACKKANIQVMMITGDNWLTAESLAKEVGLLEGGRILAGRDLDEIGNNELSGLVSRISACPRVAPPRKARPLLGSNWLYVAASIALTAVALDLFKKHGGGSL